MLGFPLDSRRCGAGVTALCLHSLFSKLLCCLAAPASTAMHQRRVSSLFLPHSSLSTKWAAADLNFFSDLLMKRLTVSLMLAADVGPKHLLRIPDDPNVPASRS